MRESIDRNKKGMAPVNEHMCLVLAGAIVGI